jgi:sec-independent protein translocase protein TatB
MFANIGWGEMILLLVVGLVVLGPERLPGAIRWASGSLRQARDYLSGATTALRQELGPEFEDLREPLGELQKLRGMTPRAALTKHLLDGDESAQRHHAAGRGAPHLAGRPGTFRRRRDVNPAPVNLAPRESGAP